MPGRVVSSIILWKRDRGEADELVAFISREFGRLTGVAKNARRSRVRFGGHLEPLTVADLMLRKRRKDQLVWIDEAQLQRWFPRLRTDVLAVARASYLIEMAMLFLPEGQPDESVYDFMVNALETLDQQVTDPFQFILLELRLLGLLGFEPRFDGCPGCDKPLERGQDAVFSVIKGGACHPACIDPGEPRDLRLSPDTVAVTRRAMTLDEQAARRLKIGRKGLQELRRALSAFVRGVKGEEINTLLFLEGLDRELEEAGKPKPR